MDADRLCEWLYEAARRRHAADPIDIRELADSIWHFLWEEFVTESPTLADMQEATIKIARELGHPYLAETLRESCQFNRSAAHPLDWPHNLLAAHELGILEIGELQAPSKLAGGWIAYQPGSRFDDSEWHKSLEQARDRFSRFAVLTDRQVLHDMPSVELARSRLRHALNVTGLRLVINLNWPISYDQDNETASLFPSLSNTETVRPTAGPLDLTNSQDWSTNELSRITWRWHVRKADLRNIARHQLRQVCVSAMSGGRWQFVFDRRNQPLTGTFGLTQNDPAMLQFVSVHMDAFVRQIQSRINSRPDLLDKLGSLARLILEVGHTRLRGIRQWGSESTGKLLYAEQSIMVVHVDGLTIWDQELASQVQSRLVRELNRDDQGISVRMTYEFGPNALIDLRSNQGVDQLLPTIGRNVESIRVIVNADHLLATERLLQVLNTVFQNTHVAEIDLEIESRIPN